MWMMDDLPKLIEEKLDDVIKDPNGCNFIKDIMMIEKNHRTNKGKLEEYDKKLEKYVKRK